MPPIVDDEDEKSGCAGLGELQLTDLQETEGDEGRKLRKQLKQRHPGHPGFCRTLGSLKMGVWRLGSAVERLKLELNF